LVPFILGGGTGNRGDLQLGNGGKAVGYGDAGGANCAECVTLYIQVKMSDNCNTSCKFSLSGLHSHSMETQLHL